LFTYFLTYLLTFLITYFITYLLNCLPACVPAYLLARLLACLLACSRVLQKPNSPQLVKKFSAFYEAQSFIAVFTSARRLSLS
jgi:hypothetical protein